MDLMQEEVDPLIFYHHIDSKIHANNYIKGLELSAKKIRVQNTRFVIKLTTDNVGYSNRVLGSNFKTGGFSEEKITYGMYSLNREANLKKVSMVLIFH